MNPTALDTHSPAQQPPHPVSWSPPDTPLDTAGAAGREPTPAEVLARFACGPRQAPTHRCIHDAIEAQVRQQPHAVAVEHLGQRLHYSELEQQANRLAARLAAAGVVAGDRVGLYLQRGIPMVVGIVAVLKLGAAYVPQCVGIAPAAQLAFVHRQAGLRAVLTLSTLQAQLPALPGPVIEIDRLLAEPTPQRERHEAFVPARAVCADDLCFVLFTSGTTGQPNGVMVSHHNVCNIVLTAPGNLGLQPGMKMAQLLNIGFDMAAWEVLACLAHGATLVIRGDDFQAVAEQVDAIIATPSILARLDATRCRQVQVVAVAGEPCPRALADEWAAFCRFYNGCGPTEVTIVNTMQRHQPQAARLTIGKPTPNNTVYVLDAQLRPCAVGETGEMWAGGACVSRGYIGDAALTAERYRPDPFLGGGRRMFRTRDLGRWTADGELEHLGRVDDQVKVRGFRVELDAVSALIERLDGCAQAVALKLDERQLVAFVRPASVSPAAARAAVQATLPYYCVPAHVVACDSFPITGRGKVDKRAMLARAQRLFAPGPVAETVAPTAENHAARRVA